MTFQTVYLLAAVVSIIVWTAVMMEIWKQR